jgi:hypothetical protein
MTQVTKTGYGALYNWWVGYAARQGGEKELIAGMWTPDDDEIIELIEYIGGTFSDPILSQMGKLMSLRKDPDLHPRFDSPNDPAENLYNYAILPGGFRWDEADLFFESIGEGSLMWSSSSPSTKQFEIYANDTDGGLFLERPNFGLSLRQTRPATVAEQDLPDGTMVGLVQDFNGNYYETVKIGNQVWTAQNLRATHYTDGTAIPNVTDDTEWAGLTTGAYCWYDNDINTPGIIFTDEFITLDEPVATKKVYLTRNGKYLTRNGKYLVRLVPAE